ncbi:lipoprotein LpqH [Mycolicibacterium vaccae]|uniref:lipoprotein LpqH n=1 Tax=Mycolicibacterium vaccae TaxID=1810 RepID=UPI003CEB6112
MPAERLKLVPLLAAAALTAGCGLTGTASTEMPAEAGRMTIDGHTQMTRSVKCTQSEWLLQIDATGNDGGRARALVELGGERPKVTAVNIEGVDDRHGVADAETGEAKASVLDGDVYTISGTVLGSDGTPGQSRNMPFEIKAPC